jgi:hypothetical protein
VSAADAVGASAAGATWAVVLAGGVGSRFWPLSTPGRPKQLLALVDEHPLLRNTLARLAPLTPARARWCSRTPGCATPCSPSRPSCRPRT